MQQSTIAASVNSTPNQVEINNLNQDTPSEQLASEQIRKKADKTRLKIEK